MLEGHTESPLFTQQEKLALRFAEEVTTAGKPTAECFAAIEKEFRPDQIVELTLLVGFWNMWNRLTDTLEVDIEERSHLVEEDSPNDDHTT